MCPNFSCQTELDASERGNSEGLSPGTTAVIKFKRWLENGDRLYNEKTGNFRASERTQSFVLISAPCVYRFPLALHLNRVKGRLCRWEARSLIPYWLAVLWESGRGLIRNIGLDRRGIDLQRERLHQISAGLFEVDVQLLWSILRHFLWEPRLCTQSLPSINHS